MYTHQLPDHTVKLSDIVRQLLEQGHHPRDVRLVLASRGIKWAYSFSVHKGGRRYGMTGSVREKRRNLKRLGMKPCSLCQMGTDINGGDVCPECLIEKWAPKAGELR